MKKYLSYFIVLFLSYASQAHTCALPQSFHPIESPRIINLSDIKLPADDWVVLNLWAVWCAPCRKELPLLDAYQAKNPAITITTLNLEDDQALITSLFHELHITHLKPQSTRDSSTLQQFNAMGLPYTAILHRGKVIANKHGTLSADDLEQIAHYLHCQNTGDPQ